MAEFKKRIYNEIANFVILNLKNEFITKSQNFVILNLKNEFITKSQNFAFWIYKFYNDISKYCASVYTQMYRKAQLSLPLLDLYLNDH